jgi:adenylylsulfate reductase subunit A
MGGYLINALGERFVHKYHPRGEKGPKWATCWAIYEEKKAGRGPIFVDCRHLSPEALEYLTEHLLPVDKLTYMDYIRQKGMTYSKDLLEVDIPAGLTGFTGDPRVMVMDERCWSGVEGLYLAGTATRPCYALTGAYTTGIVAGREAGKAAVSHAGLLMLQMKPRLRPCRKRFLPPIKREEGHILAGV